MNPRESLSPLHSSIRRYRARFCNGIDVPIIKLTHYLESPGWSRCGPNRYTPVLSGVCWIQFPCSSYLTKAKTNAMDIYEFGPRNPAGDDLVFPNRSAKRSC